MAAKVTLAILLLYIVISPSNVAAADDVTEVKGKAVVFYGPAQQEYDAHPEVEREEWTEVLSDFEYYRDLIIPFLEKNGIAPVSTVASKINIQLEGNKRHTYVRKDFDHVVGYIMTDGKSEPKVVTGVGTDSDLLMDFKEYFKIK